MPPDRTEDHATCLGCGCACDDIVVVARGGTIVDARNACDLGTRWFGNGKVPAQIRSHSAPQDIRRAIEDAARLLMSARRPLVYLADDISCETQRIAIALADVLGATLDSITTSTTGPAVLAGQRRGRVTATLGEIRNRADVVAFWGVDPAARYPRFTSRYAPEPVGLYVPNGRSGRRVIAVDIGADRGPQDADVRISFTPDEEVTALTLARAAANGAIAAEADDESLQTRAVRFSGLVGAARYAALVADGEPLTAHDPNRGESLLLLVDALNQSTRCVLSTLRGGGNRSGADVVMTWQTGFPMAVDFARGIPSYQPHRGAGALLESREADVALVVGTPASVPADLERALGGDVACIGIGPRASESPYAVAVAIDTGVAGIHEGGTAVRMDDVPLPLRPVLESDAAASARTRAAADPDLDLAAGDALAADGRPQDTLIVLRALAATVARRVESSRRGPGDA
jgi:formylmethanofuran dehydrogenase subunit B